MTVEKEGAQIAAIGEKVNLMYDAQKEFQSEMRAFQTEIRSVVGEAFAAIREMGEKAITESELDDKLELRDNRIEVMEKWKDRAEIRLQEAEKRPSWLTTIVLASVLTIAGSLIVGLSVYVLTTQHHVT